MDYPITLNVIFAIIGAAGALYGILAPRRKRDDDVTERLVRIETEIVNLKGEVEKHNHVVERTYKMESDLHTAFKHIDEQRDRIERLESLKIGE